jgi:hypothetical protein
MNMSFVALHSAEQSVVLDRIAAHWDGAFDLFRPVVGNEAFDVIKLTSSSIQTGTLLYSSFVSKSRTLATRTEYYHAAFFLIFLRQLQKYFSNLGNMRGSYT